MFYLGEYDEDETNDIRTFLSDAGIRVEVKPYLTMDEEERCTLQGRYSRLKELAKDMGDFENYLSIIRKVLPQSSSPEEFEELFMKEFDPEITEKRDRFLALCVNSESRSSEESESPDFGPHEWLSFMVKSGRALSFAQSVISLNGITIGKSPGEKLDDPLMEIPVNADDYDPEMEEIKYTIEFFLEKSFGLYVDEFTTPLASEIDDEFYGLFPDECQQLKALGLLIEKLAIAPSDKKMSLDQFTKLCTINLEDDDVTLRVDGREVSGELIRVLEKADVLKVKGDRIKWKS